MAGSLENKRRRSKVFYEVTVLGRVPHLWNLGSENTTPCEWVPGDASAYSQLSVQVGMEFREKLMWKGESQKGRFKGWRLGRGPKP